MNSLIMMVTLVTCVCSGDLVQGQQAGVDPDLAPGGSGPADLGDRVPSHLTPHLALHYMYKGDHDMYTGDHDIMMASPLPRAPP